MKKLIAAMCFMFAVSPLAMAQEKGKADEKKAAPATEKAAVKSDKAAPAAAKAEEKKAAPAVEKAAAKSDKAAPAAEKAAGKAAKAKKEPSEKQKAHREKMKSCNQEADDKKLKGDVRKKHMSACLKG